MWKVVLSTVAISSIAGNGGDATLAQVNGLAGIGRSPIGDRFLSDLGNARIRKVIADAPPPPRPLPPPLDGTISLTASQSTLDALTTFTGSISLVNAAGYTSLSLPNLTGVTADFTGNRVTIDPIAAYHFTFGTTTLNADAFTVSGGGTVTITFRSRDAAGNLETMKTTTVTPTTGASRTICTTLGNTSLLDLDLFAFKGAKGEKVKVTLAANPAGRFVNGSAVLTLAGYNLLKVDNTVLPNALSVTLSASGTYGVTVSEAILKTGTFSGAYCVTLESSGAAWSTFVRK